MTYVLRKESGRELTRIEGLEESTKSHKNKRPVAAASNCNANIKTGCKTRKYSW